MAKPELTVAVSTPEAVVAAAQGGADCVSIVPLGLGEADKPAGSFAAQNFSTSVAYCRVRGIKTCMELPAACEDGELERYEKLIRLACRCGVDAIGVSDLGLGRFARQIAPDMPLHALAGLCIHDVSGVRFAAEFGFKRVTLTGELTQRQIAYILLNAGDTEICVAVHGPQCMSYGGHCAMAGVIAEGGALVCPAPCLKAYGYGSQANEHPLMLKELCLIDRLAELQKLGVNAVRIEGAARRAEYAAAVAGIYRNALDGETRDEAGDRNTLAQLSQTGGLREGMYSLEKDKGTIGSPTDGSDEELFERVRAEYRRHERQSVAVQFYAVVRRGQRVMMAVQTQDGLALREDGPVPEPVSEDEATPAAQIRTQLYKLNDTPYYCTGAKVHIDPKLRLANEQIDALRDALLLRLGEARSEPKGPEEHDLPQLLRYPNREERPVFTVSVMHIDQLSDEMLALKPAVVYIPLEEILGAPSRVEPFIRAEDTELSVILPQIITDDMKPEIKKRLGEAHKLGVKSALLSHPAQLELAAACGFETLRADFSFNIKNSYAMREMRQLSLKSAGVSYTLPVKAIKELSKAAPAEMLVYGRLPLMLTESCLIKNHTGRCNCEVACHLIDENAGVYPLVKTALCRNLVLSAKKLWLGDRISRFSKLGLWGARLSFTTENSRECVMVMERYMANGKYEPSDYDFGVYFPGEPVEEKPKRRRRFFRNVLFD